MDPAREQFIEKMGLMFEADGGPRIAGRMLGLLLLTPGDCSLDNIAERLQVSKASISTNARLLESFGMAERTSHPGDRRDYYRIAEDLQGRMMERKLERMRQIRDLIDEGQSTVVFRDEQVRARFAALHHLHDHIVQSIEEGLEQLRACQGPPAASTRPDRP